MYQGICKEALRERKQPLGERKNKSKINPNNIMKTFLDKETQQVNVLDERFYTQDNKQFFPSVTTVLQSYPKGSFFEKWLMDTGRNAEQIKKDAGIQGSNVHNAIDGFLKGSSCTLIDRDGHENFTLNEWKMICRFMRFFECIDKDDFLSESMLFDKQLRLGGTEDLVCTINGERWLIDYKTSNALHETYKMQLAMYRKMHERIHGEKIDRYGVLWLNAKTRTNKPPLQGKGWQIKEYTDSYDHDVKLFEHTRAIWDNVNPNYAPKNLQFPNTFKLDGKKKDK